MIVELNATAQMVAALLSIPVVILDFYACSLLFLPAIKIKKIPEVYIVRAVFILFASKTLLEIYLGLVWGLSYLGFEFGELLYNYGVFFHILASQLVGVAASVYAIKAVHPIIKRHKHV